MGGDDFNKTDDGEENSNYEIDISAIIEQSIKEHDKNIDQQKSVNRVWRDSFFETIWRKRKNLINNEIIKAVKQGFSQKENAVYRQGNRSINIILDSHIEHRHPPFMNRGINSYYTLKRGAVWISLDYFFENGLNAGISRAVPVEAISGEELQGAFCSHVKGKIAGCKAVNLSKNIVRRKIDVFGISKENYTQYEMEIVW